MIVNVTWFNQTGPFLLWLDADTSKIIKLESLIKDGVPAVGAVYNRDPGVGPTTSSFQVDPSSGGQYTLSLARVFTRIAYAPNPVLDLSISHSANRRSATFDHFNTTPINRAS